MAHRALAIGYGSRTIISRGTPGALELYRPTSGAIPGGVYHYVPGSAWTLLNSGLPSGFTWTHIKASPFDASHLLLLGYNSTPNSSGGVVLTSGVSPLWLSTNGGATWSAVSLSDGGVGPQTSYTLFDVDWSTSTPGQWAAVARAYDSFTLSLWGLLWRGTLATNSVLMHSGTSPDFRWLTAVAAGQNNEWIVVSRTGDDGNLGVISQTATSITLVGLMVGYGDTTLERSPTSRAITVTQLSYPTNPVLASTDYRSVVPSASSISHGRYTSWSTTGLYSNGLEAEVEANGVEFTATPSTAPTIVYSTVYAVRYVRVDRQTRTGVAATVTDAAPLDRDVLVYDGSDWSRVTGPGGTDALSLAVEVVRR